MYIYIYIWWGPSGYVNRNRYEKLEIIVDLPIKHGDSPSLCRRLPEGKLTTFVCNFQ